MNIKTYKLVPISFFGNMEKSDINADKNLDNERSIKDIVSATNFTPSKHYVADFKIPKPVQDGGGGSVTKKKYYR